MRKKPSCEKCKAFYKKRNKLPDCKNCPPEVMPENEDAIAVYSQVHGQAIYVGMDGVAVDLDFNALKFVMDLVEVEDPFDCFQKVLKMWHHINTLDRMKRKTK